MAFIIILILFSYVTEMGFHKYQQSLTSKNSKTFFAMLKVVLDNSFSIISNNCYKNILCH